MHRNLYLINDIVGFLGLKDFINENSDMFFFWSRNAFLDYTETKNENDQFSKFLTLISDSYLIRKSF